MRPIARSQKRLSLWSCALKLLLSSLEAAFSPSEALPEADPAPSYRSF